MAIESAVYKITSARSGLFISLENGDPRGNFVVKPENSDPSKSDNYQKWAVVHQSDGIYTFKSLIEDFEGIAIPDSKKPYARNSKDDKSVTCSGVMFLLSDAMARPGSLYSRRYNRRVHNV
ncbi:hypothetical protein K443DRAFT_15155 [Laccaria amethystina LaAM-08-1]|uniref:Ricin B lectin domain-containing protein n=1 Tax=Laccaria amethystina LaAM-08-1 TaxID=1095629 RepID=A0A0C9WYW8_9AGAR|nr:hypothetical protein K443DRAFT_15155 [Laccaria amethystina LaAM-08-1]